MKNVHEISERLRILTTLKNKCNVQFDFSAAKYYANKAQEVSIELTDAMDKLESKCQ